MVDLGGIWSAALIHVIERELVEATFGDINHLGHSSKSKLLVLLGLRGIGRDISTNTNNLPPLVLAPGCTDDMPITLLTLLGLDAGRDISTSIRDR